MQDKVICRTPTPNKKPTRIDKWKFDLIHNAILEICQLKEMEYYLRIYRI